VQIIYGTKNNGKVMSMQKSLDRLKPDYDIELIGMNQLNDVFPEVPEVEENGGDPLENARKKAMAYYSLTKKPVFSSDSGLYFDGLPDNLQPGLNIRRVNGRRLNDDEMIDYYSQLAKDNGGELVARYVNGICLIMGDDLIFEHMGENISTAKFIITPIPHSKRIDGFPLDSLSIHIASKMYFFDMQNEKFDKEDFFSIDNGFREFFISALCAYKNS
jgi:8-oxo-dGTP diphosphatase